MLAKAQAYAELHLLIPGSVRSGDAAHYLAESERIFRRLRIYDIAVGEIGFFDPDEYVNPHAR